MKMTPTERAEYNSILHQKAANKLYRITNREPIEMGKLIVCTDPEDSNHYPFWVAEVGEMGGDRNSQNYKCVQV